MSDFISALCSVSEELGTGGKQLKVADSTQTKSTPLSAYLREESPRSKPTMSKADRVFDSADKVTRVACSMYAMSRDRRKKFLGSVHPSVRRKLLGEVTRINKRVTDSVIGYRPDIAWAIQAVVDSNDEQAHAKLNEMSKAGTLPRDVMRWHNAFVKDSSNSEMLLGSLKGYRVTDAADNEDVFVESLNVNEFLEPGEREESRLNGAVDRAVDIAEIAGESSSERLSEVKESALDRTRSFIEGLVDVMADEISNVTAGAAADVAEAEAEDILEEGVENAEEKLEEAEDQLDAAADKIGDSTVLVRDSSHPVNVYFNEAGAVLEVGSGLSVSVGNEKFDGTVVAINDGSVNISCPSDFYDALGVPAAESYAVEEDFIVEPVAEEVIVDKPEEVEDSANETVADLMGEFVPFKELKDKVEDAGPKFKKGDVLFRDGCDYEILDVTKDYAVLKNLQGLNNKAVAVSDLGTKYKLEKVKDSIEDAPEVYHVVHRWAIDNGKKLATLGGKPIEEIVNALYESLKAIDDKFTFESGDEHTIKYAGSTFAVANRNMIDVGSTAFIYQTTTAGNTAFAEGLASEARDLYELYQVEESDVSDEDESDAVPVGDSDEEVNFLPLPWNVEYVAEKFEDEFPGYEVVNTNGTVEVIHHNPNIGRTQVVATIHPSGTLEIEEDFDGDAKVALEEYIESYFVHEDSDVWPDDMSVVTDDDKIARLENKLKESEDLGRKEAVTILQNQIDTLKKRVTYLEDENKVKDAYEKISVRGDARVDQDTLHYNTEDLMRYYDRIKNRKLEEDDDEYLHNLYTKYAKKHVVDATDSDLLSDEAKEDVYQSIEKEIKDRLKQNGIEITDAVDVPTWVPKAHFKESDGSNPYDLPHSKVSWAKVRDTAGSLGKILEAVSAAKGLKEMVTKDSYLDMLEKHSAGDHSNADFLSAVADATFEWGELDLITPELYRKKFTDREWITDNADFLSDAFNVEVLEEFKGHPCLVSNTAFSEKSPYYKNIDSVCEYPLSQNKTLYVGRLK